MQENFNNIIKVSGQIANEITESHKVYSETFYTFKIRVKRLSENFDILPITVSERLIDKKLLLPGEIINIDGQIRSYNNYNTEDARTKLILTIFARQIDFNIENENPNEVYLNGYVCKMPVYRKTPFGREITDILLAVNRSYNKSDYIPCIAWGRNAKFAAKLNIADNIKIQGRMQSREYQKKLITGEVLNKTAYELSVSRIELQKTDENESE